MQQDYIGVYETQIIEKKDCEEPQEKRDYITNFNIVAAKIIRFVGEGTEGIELVLKSQDGELFTRVGDVNIFNDVRSFKNFLGTMALTFNGGINGLDRLKNWIYKYFTYEIKTIYTGIQFKDGMLITPNGSITSNGINTKIVCNCDSEFVLSNEMLTKQEAKSLIQNLFKFNKEEFCCSILGTIVNNLAIEKTYKKGVKLHHLLIIGESGSGKSTTKENIINPILGYPSSYTGAAIKNITKFALTKKLSEGNYTKIFDEYKPSEMSKYSCDMINDMMKNCYDRSYAERGNKDLSVTKYRLNSPIVICGEENFKNKDKASIERSLIVYLSKSERPATSGQALQWLKDNEIILNKLGNTVLNKILNMSDEDYYNIRALYKECNTFGLKDRPLNTFINACTGMHILEETLEEVIGERVEVPNFIDGIANVIKDNIMQDGKEARSNYENMLLKINDMVLNEPHLRDDNSTHKILIDKNRTYIRLNLILDDLSRYKKNNGLDFILINKEDFIEQCKKSGYITRANMSKRVKGQDGISTSIKTYEFDTDKLFNLGCYELIGRGVLDKKQKEHLNIIEEEQQTL